MAVPPRGHLPPPEFLKGKIMQGAREYASLFTTSQYGKLYIVSGKHARGLTFRIQVLPEGEIAKGNGSGNLCTNKNAVEVYGVISGNPGWTESYGWLHRGKWVEDFQLLLANRKKEIKANEEKNHELREAAASKESRRIANLLLNY